MNAWWSTLWQSDQADARWLILVGITLVAAATDYRSRRIPNALTLPALVGGLVAGGVLDGWAGLGDAAAGAGLCLVPFVILFVFAGGGAGDAKLMAAVGAWAGVLGGLIALASVLLTGAVLALGWMIHRRAGRAVWGNFLWILMSLRTAVTERGRARRDYLLPAAESLHPMPYGLAIGAGCVLAAGVVYL